jgi:arylsulfatase
MSGKWHVGYEHGVTPKSRGFDRSLNATAGGFYYAGADRSKLFLDSEPIANDDPRLPKGWYTTDLWTEFGLRFIDEAVAAKKPFYLHLCHNAPHFPLQAPADAIAKFRGTYRTGWDKLREARIQRQRELGIFDTAWTPAMRPAGVQAWDTLASEEKDRFDHLMAVYAATVFRMDKAIGDLVAGLRTRGLLDNTLILFMSDNGGNAESGVRGRTDGDPSMPRSQWYCGESWAFLQNVPFRKYKHYNHEGGIATPLIVHWPQGIAARGELRSQPGHLIDVVPTCIAAAGATYPTTFNGHPVLPLEGHNLLPTCRDNTPLPREALYWEHEGNAAVRVGDEKLVRTGRNGPWELYNLKTDRTEQQNLADANPDKVQQLTAIWTRWAERAHVIPYPTAKPRNAGKAGKASDEAPLGKAP